MWLAIEGLIGAGKTTTAEIVAGMTQLSGVIERSGDHPFLEAYYSDPTRYAMETEIAFMLLQIHQMHLPDLPNDLVSDFSPAKNLIFARINCSDDDFQFLRALDRRLWAKLAKPDLAIFLDVPVDVCLTRIATRGRSYEKRITTADLENLRAEYLGAFRSLGSQVKLVALEGTESPTEVAETVLREVDLQEAA